MMTTFRFLEDIEEVRAVYPVMHELRTQLSEGDFIELFEAARRENGYRLLGAFSEAGVCVGLMGFRLLTDFVHGRHLYVDDLVTTEAERSRGLGSEFLKQAKRLAAENGCKGLRLCTGVENDRGKAFYQRQGWQARALAFKLRL
jgi:GNAT superfamily N-acetyltransferase